MKAKQVERNCAISAADNGQRMFLLIPILTKICDDVEYENLDTDKKLQDCVDNFLKRPSNKIEVTINNEPIKHLKNYEIKTGKFPVELPNGGLYSLHGVTGSGSARAGGYWIVTQVFPQSSLAIHLKGETSLVSPEEDKTIKYIAGSNFCTEVLYNITTN
ncbi:MAG: hypothetical protein JO297_21285 [Nitrososphaeraceae archaeon]|nr:hypothetical protein [Nitrososphaeraceae archaeon]